MAENPPRENVFHGQWVFYIEDLTGLSVADMLTTYTPGFPGAITKIYAVGGTTVVSTGSKGLVANMEIGTTDLQGGVLTLVSADFTTIGGVKNATAIAGSNRFGRTDTISMECSAETGGGFSEGDMYVVVGYEGRMQMHDGGDWERDMYPQTFHTTICVPVLLSSIPSGDLVTNIVPGFVGWIKKFSYYNGTVCSTGSKLATLNLEIGTTDVTGGVLSLDSDDLGAVTGAVGMIVSGTAVTGANMFDKDDTLSIEATSVTTFVEGSGSLIIEMEGPVLR